MLGAVFYIAERLYVTPEEAVDYAVEDALTAFTEHDMDQLDQRFHDSMFDAPPPKLLKRMLPHASRSRNQWTREELKSGLQDVFNRISIKRYVRMKQDITTRNGQATVQLQVLFFYRDGSEDESDDTVGLPSKFLSSWTIRFRKERDVWKIYELSYGNTG